LHSLPGSGIQHTVLNSEYRLPRRESIGRQTYRTLRLAILRRDVKPGTRIIESEFARALGVSRTPLREALSRLEADGLVSPLPAGGYVVNDANEELEEIFHCRLALEGYAARLAARAGTPEEIAGLKANVQATRRVAHADTRRRVELNAEFHRLVTDMARAPRLRKLINDVWDFMWSEETMQRHSEREMRAALEEHDALLAALERRDEDRAETLMRRHIAGAFDFFKKSAVRDGDR
jgi:DNA-binding GntR family transcriptional regulator